MPLSYAELEKFYKGLVARARRRGIACAITSGMACVAYGVAQARRRPYYRVPTQTWREQGAPAGFVNSL